MVHLHISTCDTLPLDNLKAHLHLALPYITIETNYMSLNMKRNLPQADDIQKLLHEDINNLSYIMILRYLFDNK